MIKNALLNVSLAGAFAKNDRDEVNAVIDNDPSCNYVVLFKGQLGRTDYRALYRQEYTVEQDQEATIVKVHGAPGAPTVVSAEMVQGFFKYNSGAKEFVQISQRQFTTTTDGLERPVPNTASRVIKKLK